jgi:rod shape-determining protein MreC
MNTSVRSFHKYFSLREENDILSAENARLRNLLERERAAFSASKIITDTVIAQDTSVLNDSIRKVNYFYIPAMVVNNSVNKQNNLITIDKGAKDGVYTEMAVISDEGVVGIVTRTSEHFARVLPILNRNFRLSAKIKRNNYFGIIEWDGVSAESVPLKPISGMGSLWRRSPFSIS